MKGATVLVIIKKNLPLDYAYAEVQRFNIPRRTITPDYIVYVANRAGIECNCAEFREWSFAAHDENVYELFIERTREESLINDFEKEFMGMVSILPDPQLSEKMKEYTNG